MAKLLYYVSKDGKLLGNPVSLLKELINKYRGKNISITVKQEKGHRTNPMNAYLWGCVYVKIQEGFFDATGEEYTPEQVHHYLKNKFLSDKVVINGATITTPPTDEYKDFDLFWQYVEQVRTFSAHFLNVIIPEPNPYWRNETETKTSTT